MAEIPANPIGQDLPGPAIVVAADANRDHPADRGKLRVFISYSRVESDFADQLQAALQTCGFECVIDREDISGGEDWKTRLSALIAESDTVVFVLSPSSARSEICGWEADQSAELGKRILPVVCRSLGDASLPARLRGLNYIFFYAEPAEPGSGFGHGLKSLSEALNTDFEWLREHTRYLQRASEWNDGGRPSNRLLTGSDIAQAKTWAARRPKTAPEPTALQLDFIRASEAEAEAQSSAEFQRLKAMQEANAQREAALREKEAAVERAQDEQKRRARTEKARNLLVVVSVVVAAATLLLAWFAQNERKHAEALLTSAKPIVAGAQYQMDDAGRREAFKFFQVASGLGDASSTGYVGVSFRNGWGAPQDYAQALHFLRDAANEGDANAMDNLGSIYDSGEAEKQGFAQDFAQAREWYERAAHAGNIGSMVNLGRLYDSGRGVDKDYSQAREWYLNAAKNGQPEAMFAIAALYESGKGVELDTAAARDWYQQAAKAGHAGAMVRLGAIYERGRGVPVDVAQAVDWYNRAAKQNDPQAMFRLGALAEQGRGIAQDSAEAIVWYKRAADAQHLGAMRRLGAVYEEGVLVSPDAAKARFWREAAAKEAGARAGVATGGVAPQEKGPPEGGP
jgi:TPR repeat protein